MIRATRFAALGLSLGLAMAQPGLAKDLLGTTHLNGKEVQLFDDGTWSYAGEQAGDCIALSTQIEFCDTDGLWRAEQTTGDFATLFSSGPNTIAGVIVEDTGSQAGINLDFMRLMALENAASASGVAKEDIPVLHSQSSDIAGHPAETLVYGARINDVGVIFANTFVILDQQTLQVVVWEFGETYTDDHRMRTEHFLSNLKIGSQGQE